MSRVLLLAVAALGLAACNMNVRVDPEGHRCNPGGGCPAGYLCQQDVCRAVGCAQVQCTTPPAPPTCAGAVLRVYNGRCEASTGACVYEPQDTTCTGGCQAGACKDLCAGKACTTPPNATCASATTLRTFAQVGSCAPATGDCEYAPQDTTCTNGCSGGVCQGQDLCVGKVCDAPPANTCVGTVARTFAATGTCTPGTGQCTYAFTDTPCAGQCVTGTCVAPSLTFTQVGPRVRFAVNAVDISPTAIGGDNVLVVGNGGQAARWNGTDWAALATGTMQDLNAVFYSSGSLAWLVGRNRTVLQVRSAAVGPPASMPSFSGSANLVSVHGRTDANVLIVDEGGAVAKWNGFTWTGSTLGPTATRMRQLYVDETARERVAGLCTVGGNPRGCLAYRNPALGTGWTMAYDAATALDAVGAFVDIGSTTTSEAYVGRADNLLRRHQPPSTFDTTDVPSLPEGDGVRGITGVTALTGSRAVFVLTSSATAVGHLYRLVKPGGGGTPTVEPVLDTYFGAESLSPNEATGVIVAETRRLRNANNIFRRSTIVDQALDLGEDWVGATTDTNGNLVLVSNFGDVGVRRASAAVYDFRRGPFVDARAAEARNGTGVLVVGQDGASTDGAIERFTPPNTFTPISVTAPNTIFNAVCRVSDGEAWVVGTGGAVVQVSGTSATPVNAGTTKDLLAVDCSGGQVVACGADGVVLRRTGTSWAAVSPPLPVGTGVFVTGCFARAGALYAAGDGFFARLDPGAPSWTSLNGRAGLAHLVVRSPSEVYATAGSGTAQNTEIVRFDGAQWRLLATAPAPLGGGVQIGARVVYGGTYGVLMEGR